VIVKSSFDIVWWCFDVDDDTRLRWLGDSFVSRWIFKQLRKRPGSISLLIGGERFFWGNGLGYRIGFAIQRSFNWGFGGNDNSSFVSHVDNHCWIRSVFLGNITEKY